jgi:hypothetical protein
MNFVKIISDHLWRWFIGPFSSRFRTVHRSELPDIIKANTIYLIGDDEPWSLAFICPCGCKQIIQLSLLLNDSPRWRLYLDRRRLPTIHPSVWRTVGCRSHFFIRAGVVIWCLEDSTYFKEAKDKPISSRSLN